MHSVLIVDDEEPVLDSFGFMLENCAEGYALAGKARSGFEAIKMIYELRPDVVFMDINMPGIDGIDTIAKVYEQFPDTVFVLSTAYERFDLARRAIPLGVYAYLVKPISKKDFIDTLEGVRSLLAKRRSMRISRQDGALAQQFLREEVWKSITPERWAVLRESLCLDSDKGLVAFIGIDSEGEGALSAVNAELAFRRRFLTIEHLGLGMYFFPGDLDREVVGRDISDAIASRLPSASIVLIGVGSARPGCELHLSCAQALAELNERREGADVRLRERLRIIEIRRKIGLSSFEEVDSVFTEYWEEVFGAYDFGVAKAKMVALLTLIADDCTDLYKSHSSSAPASLPAIADEIAPLADLPSWIAWSGSAFRGIYQCACRSKAGRYPAPLVKAMAFIDERLAEQIRLSDAAEAASVSPAYLSRLFGECLGSNFVDYLTALRVEKAERLIREGAMSVKEVAAGVGYPDPNYFSKVFRKIVGISPSMYRTEGSPS